MQEEQCYNVEEEQCDTVSVPECSTVQEEVRLAGLIYRSPSPGLHGDQ